MHARWTLALHKTTPSCTFVFVRHCEIADTTSDCCEALRGVTWDPGDTGTEDSYYDRYWFLRGQWTALWSREQNDAVDAIGLHSS